MLLTYSPTCIKRAEKGIYDLSTIVRKDPLADFGSEIDACSRFFEVPKNKKIVMRNDIKTKVNFEVKDVFKEKLKNKYDVIFCFNFLGQFSENKRKIVFKKFSQSLKKTWVLNT